MRADQFFDRAFSYLERHVDLRAGNVLVFDFGFGQRGFFHRAPHHRLRPAIEIARFGKFHQLGHDGRLAVELHGQIGIVPVRHDAQPLQLFALHIDPVLRIGAAFGAEFLRRDRFLVQLLLAVLFLDLPLDRQAVAVPARNIGRVFAQQVLRAADHVLQRVVQRMADMHVAIGVGRTIVEDELLAVGARLAQLLIQPVRFPACGNARLLLGEAGLHGEIGLRQEDGISVIALFGHRCWPLGQSSRVGKCGVACPPASYRHPRAGRDPARATAFPGCIAACARMTNR